VEDWTCGQPLDSVTWGQRLEWEEERWRDGPPEAQRPAPNDAMTVTGTMAEVTTETYDLPSPPDSILARAFGSLPLFFVLTILILIPVVLFIPGITDGHGGLGPNVFVLFAVIFGWLLVYFAVRGTGRPLQVKVGPDGIQLARKGVATIGVRWEDPELRIDLIENPTRPESQGGMLTDRYVLTGVGLTRKARIPRACFKKIESSARVRGVVMTDTFEPNGPQSVAIAPRRRIVRLRGTTSSSTGNAS
jgi:hypothetical protein